MSDTVNMIAGLWGEVITYVPYNGTAKQFKAIVERNRPSPQLDSAVGVLYGVNKFEVKFPVDATNGVLTVAKGKDLIRFKKLPMDADETEFRIVQILEYDPIMGGMWHLEVQA